MKRVGWNHHRKHQVSCERDMFIDLQFYIWTFASRQLARVCATFSFNVTPLEMETWQHMTKVDRLYFAI